MKSKPPLLVAMLRSVVLRSDQLVFLQRPLFKHFTWKQQTGEKIHSRHMPNFLVCLLFRIFITCVSSSVMHY